MLRSYTNQDDIVIGTPVANRHYHQTQYLIGFFVNTVALRINIHNSSKLTDFIKQLGDQVIEAQIHQDLPFEKLVDELNVEKDTSRHPIFQVMFGLQSFGNNNIDKENYILLPYEDKNIQYNIAKFDIETFIDDSEDILRGAFNYRVTLYKKNTIKGFINTYIQILQQIADIDKNNENFSLQNLKYLSTKEEELILKTWNDTDKEYPHDKTIHSLFEDQVLKTPNNIAVIYEDIKLTYKQLNDRANQLAHYLIKHHNIKPDTLIALLLDRSEHMLITILAVLKAGAAYVPMDPHYPDDRIKYILSDTNTTLVLANNIYTKRIKKLKKVNVIPIDDNTFLKEIMTYHSTNTIVKELTSSNLAYVIYTSGTTGNPKGVMIEHKGVVNLIKVQSKEFFITSIKDIKIKNWLFYANYIFDAHIWEIFSSILSGCSLHVIDGYKKYDFDYLAQYINSMNINIGLLPPAILKDKRNDLNLKILLVGGDSIDKQSLDYYLKKGSIVINAYGPSEATVCSTLNHYKEGDISDNIGTPISNTKAYVLSSDLSPLPIGAVGELYVGGVGLARGYLNNPDLTAKRFIHNPFQSKKEKKCNKNSRIYKTGDLVRWLPDGNLEYIGRNDFQVKIRGFRIELGEIESVLSRYIGVKQAVVLAKEKEDTNNKYLIAYYTSDNGDKLDEDAILSYLATKLPEYMIPTALLHMDKLPLTLSGKLDRKALPSPILGSTEENYVHPRNELETKLCNIFADVLGLESSNVGINDDFFRLGGDSIVSIQLVSRIRQTLAINYITIKDIFSFKTIERLYDNLIKDKLEDTNKILTEQGILSGRLSLLPIQKWFFDNNFTIPHHWNQAFIIKTPNLDVKILEKCLTVLLKHHDAFRLRYSKDNIQYYDNKADIEKLKILDLNKLTSDKELHSILTNLQNNFNILNGPTYSIAYIYGFKDGSTRVFFALHHLIVDAVSWRILTQNLKELYYQATSGTILSLGNKLTSYRQWTNIVKNYSTKNEKQYWNNIIKEIPEINKQLEHLSLDLINTSNFSLTNKLTTSLLKDSTTAYNTEINDLLLSALSLSLKDTLGNEINLITLEGHGREENIAKDSIDISRTLGWFTTMYPVKLIYSNTISDTIKYIKENLRNISNKGIGYGTLLGYNTLPKISFNYLGQLDQSEKDNYWSIIGEDTGIPVSNKNKDKNIININGVIINEKLQFNITTKLPDNLHNKLTKTFKEKLEEVINHTSTLERSYLTVSDVDNIIKEDYLHRIQDRREIEKVYLANSLQQGFIYHHLKQGDVDDAYLVQIIWQYNNNLNLNLLKKAWQYAQNKYLTLRLRLHWEEELIQIIDKKGNLDWRYIDLTKIKDTKKQNLEIKKIQKNDRKIKYDLEKGNLFRVYIIKQRDNLYTCIFSNHHAILDGWSMPILLKY